MGYVAISRAREDVIIFTNSTDQLRTALDRNVNKEMAIEALRQSRDRQTSSREELQRLVSPSCEHAISEQGFDQRAISTAGEERNGDERAAGEEIELELNS